MTNWIISSVLISLVCASAWGANYLYEGSGIDPDEWLDDANWSDGSGVADWPTGSDNALFSSSLGMTITQTVPLHGQLQVGRGATNAVIIGVGGAVYNSNQTVVGITDHGQGTLIIDGGTLTTVRLRQGVLNEPAGSLVQVKGGVLDVNMTDSNTKGLLDIGEVVPAVFELSGGVVSVESSLNLHDGVLRVIGSQGMLSTLAGFYFGTGPASDTALIFELDSEGGVSSVGADSFEMNGVASVEIDASAVSGGEVLNLVLIDLGSDTFSAAEFSALSNALKTTWVQGGELSLSGDRHQLLFTGTAGWEGTRITSIDPVGGSVRLMVETTEAPANLSVLGCSGLTSEWRRIALATNAAGGFYEADLSRAPSDGSNLTVYLPASQQQAFYGIEKSSLADRFTVAAESDPALTTHSIVSGGFELGISDVGGGYINRLTLPGIGDVMGPVTDRYGRGGQSAIRDALHGSRYNPTQAGFSDQAGTVCRVVESLDNTVLAVAPRPCCLFRGDGKFDFTEWENLVSDNYTESGGSNDWDTIDESLLAGQQATEITSEFDYFCTYEVCTNASIPGFRHYYEYQYVRDPGHCILQHNLGPLYDPVAGEVTDLSVDAPSGVDAASSNDLGVLQFSISIRMDRELWAPEYCGRVYGLDISDLAMESRGSNATVRTYYKNTEFASRAPGYVFPSYATVQVPLFILADSDDVDQSGALGLYFPDSDINVNSVVGVDSESGVVVYKDDRRLHMETRDSPFRISTMQWDGFRGYLLGMLNPTRTPEGTHEVLRGEFYLLYGSPREIFESAQSIEAF
ncbi:hypothetical protein P4B35_10780 [Pontiellaceae bacterium B12227]|nr:hypothetical protein [Pontiellaceae bacterium B12227]